MYWRFFFDVTTIPLRILAIRKKNVGRMSTFFVANIHKQKFLNESKIAHKTVFFDSKETLFRKTNQGTNLSGPT